MHGISKRKHEHLIEALVLLERLLEQRINEQQQEQDSAGLVTNFGETAAAVNGVRQQLNDMFESYNTTLDSLALIIKGYDELYAFSRTEYLAKVLKDLRRTTFPNGEQFEPMRENIQIVYKT